MRSDKLGRAIAQYDGFKGHDTVRHVMSTIPADLQGSVTGKQLGIIMSIRNAAYQEGKSAANDNDGCVWIDEANDGAGALIPKSILPMIKTTETVKYTTKKTDTPSSSYNFNALYRDDACTDRIVDCLDAHYMQERGECAYYRNQESIISYTLSAEEKL